MSDAPPGKSHAVIWTLLLSAIPLLYFLTVPFLKYAIVRPKWVILVGRGVKPTHAWVSTAPLPDWLRTYGAPFHWLKRETPLGPACGLYEDWVFRLLGK
jgi:hypothetical protein